MTLREFIFALVAQSKGVAWEMPVVINHRGNGFEIGGVETQALAGGKPKVIVLTKGED